MGHMQQTAKVVNEEKKNARSDFYDILAKCNKKSSNFFQREKKIIKISVLYDFFILIFCEQIKEIKMILKASIFSILFPETCFL